MTKSLNYFKSMKNILFFIFTLFCSSALYAEADSARVQIIDATGNCSRIGITCGEFVNFVNLKNGKSIICVPIKHSSYATLKVQNQYNLIIYIEKGDELTITIQNQDAVFSGKNGSKNSFINKNNLINPTRSNEAKLLETIQMNNKIIDKQGFDKEFADTEKLRSATSLYLKMDVTKFHDEKWKPVFENILEGDETLSTLEEYCNNINLFLSKLSENASATSEDNKLLNATKTKLLNTEKYVKNPILKEFLIKNYSINFIKKYPIDSQMSQLTKNNMKNADNLALFISLEEKWNLMSEGQPFPIFNAIKLDGTPFLLSELKGKVIYVDFWYSKCGPCRKEIRESAPTLHDKFSQQSDVVFLYINVDTKPELWREAVDQDKARSIHIHLVGAMENPLLEKMLVNSFPRYMIIDKEGAIYSAKAARPSNLQSVEMIEQALSKSIYQNIMSEAKMISEQRYVLSKNVLDKRRNGKSVEDDENKLEILNNQRADLYVKFIHQNPNSSMVANAFDELCNNSKYNILDAETLFANLSKKNLAVESIQKIKSKIDAAKRTELGADAIPFTINDSLGRAISVSDFKGKYLLISFWASWCGPCRAGNPDLLRIYNKYKDYNFEILGVSLDGAAKKMGGGDNEKCRKLWLDAVRKDKLTWTQVCDFKGFDGTVCQSYGVTQVPTTFLISPDGKIIGKQIKGKELEDTLKNVLRNEK